MGQRKKSFTELKTYHLDLSCSIYKHDTIDIADPSSMQDACHMNLVIESLYLRSEVRFLMGNPNFFLSPTLSTRLKTSFSVLYRAHNLLCLLFYLHTFTLFRYRNQISVERFKLVFMFLGFDKVVFFPPAANWNVAQVSFGYSGLQGFQQLYAFVA